MTVLECMRNQVGRYESVEIYKDGEKMKLSEVLDERVMWYGIFPNPFPEIKIDEKLQIII